jgi:SHS2 domain-containing protein
VRDLALGATHVRAELDFVKSDPAHLVKAVTYHRLAFDEYEGGYRATAVLDV